MRTPDPFIPLAKLVELQVFGEKSIAWLREVAWLQTKDPAEWHRAKKRLRASWSVVNDYPKFVRVGGRLGLYRSQILAYEAERKAS